MTIELGILLALCSALVTNLGFLLKHRGACAAPDVDLRHPVRSAVGLFRSSGSRSACWWPPRPSSSTSRQ
jgi:hypothetical protein